MNITGALADMVLEIDPIGYSDYIVEEQGQRVIYVEVLWALYGMLESALIWYQRFWSDSEKIGFIFNPCYGCVANRTINGKQHTVRFHVDRLLSSHVDPKVNNKFLLWLNEMYGAHGEVKATRGKVHSFLGVMCKIKNGKICGENDFQFFFEFTQRKVCADTGLREPPFSLQR